MKKILALLLTLCLMTAMLWGCGVDDVTDQTGTSAPVGTPGDEIATTQPEETVSEDTQSGETAPATNTEDDSPVTIAETVIYDADGLKVTVTGIDEDELFGTKIKILVENNTDKNVAFSGDVFVVNGVTVSAALYAEVAAGKKTNDSITLYSEYFEKAGIERIATVTGYDAHFIDTDSYETICETPFTLETSAVNHVQEIYDEGEVIFQQDGVTIIAQGISEDWLGTAVNLLVKNETDSAIILSADNVSVNGFTLTAWLYDTVCPGTVSYTSLTLTDTDLEENSIDEIENVTFTLSVLDAETYKTLAESDELIITAGE